jgi:rhodanese-related sulfurtransferase
MKGKEKYISHLDAIKAQKQRQGIIVDVREPIEFIEGHIPNVINLPATDFNLMAYEEWSHSKIFLICQTGDRAKSIAHKLYEAGMTEVYIFESHMENVDVQAFTQIWSIDRQFRFILGVFIALFLIGYHWMSTLFIIIPIILCLGLIVTAIIDKCYLRVGIALLPWNKMQKEDAEYVEISA